MVVVGSGRKEGLTYSTFLSFIIGPVSEQIMLLQNIGTSVQVSENQVFFFQIYIWNFFTISLFWLNRTYLIWELDTWRFSKIPWISYMFESLCGTFFFIIYFYIVGGV